MMKKDQLVNKEKENSAKILRSSDDIVNSNDYMFSQKHGIERVGDSGNLILGYSRTNKQDKYIIKHYFTDCACNEFIYSKLSNKIGVSVPIVKLMRVDKDDKNKYFYTEYINQFINH
ncbi:MAG: hypothetical protein ACM3TR_12105 [Caulobacteraceae bacterium]